MGARGCYNGKDVLKAVHNVIDIIPPTVRELDAADQKSLDEKPIKAR
jgi:enolase